MLARIGPSGEPIAMPSVCRYMTPSKLNSTEDVALTSIDRINSSGCDGFGMSGSLYRASSEIAMVSRNGTLVNKLTMSKEHINVPSISFSAVNRSMTSQNSNESFNIRLPNFATTGCSNSASHLAIWYCGAVHH